MQYNFRAKGGFKFIFWAYILIEIALFIIIGSWLGVLATLLLIVVTTVLGFAILRRENVTLMQKMQTAFQSGEQPNLNIFASSCAMLAGILLILPGFLTDFIGVLCLIPNIREKILHFIHHGKTTQPKGRSVRHGETIEGEYWKNEPEDAPGTKTEDEAKDKET